MSVRTTVIINVTHSEASLVKLAQITKHILCDTLSHYPTWPGDGATDLAMHVMFTERGENKEHVVLHLHLYLIPIAGVPLLHHSQDA